MPPPKKPKNGPITMEQFLGRDDLSDEDSPRNRKESCSGESDISLSVPSRRVSVASSEDAENSHSDDRTPGLKLLRDLILKKQEASRENDPEVRDSIVEDQGETSLNNEDQKDVNRNSSTGSPVLLSGEEKMSLSQSIQESISKNEKILNSIVVSTLMPTVARPQGLHSSYLSPYLYSRSMSVSPYLSPNEPRDLSTKLHTNTSESLYGRDPSTYGIGQYGQVSPERKEFLDSRKNLVGILTESRYGQNSVGLRIPSAIHDRDAFSFYLNGFDTTR